MKKMLSIIATLATILSMSSCSENKKKEDSLSSVSTEDVVYESTIPGNDALNVIYDLEDEISEDFEERIGLLESEWEQIKKDVTSYSKYVSNVEIVKKYYNKVYSEVEEMTIVMNEYALKFAEVIMSSDLSAYDKYDELGVIYDAVYDEAGDMIYDEIYDGILDDAYDTFYQGVLDEQPKNIEYSVWSKIRSAEYKTLSDIRSDVYKILSNSRSDIYDFSSDIRGYVYEDEYTKANMRLAHFKEDVEKLRED